MLDPDGLVSAAEIGEWVGLHERQVRKLAERQVIRRDGKGRYQLKTTVRAIANYQREQSAGRVALETEGLDLVQERAGLARAQRIAQEVKNQIVARQIVTVADILRVVEPMLSAVRTAYLALPSRAAPLMPTCQTASQAFKVLTDHVHDVLNHLAEGAVVAGQIQDRATGETDA